MNRGQFQDESYTVAGIKRHFFKWQMTAATTFTIIRAPDFKFTGTQIARTGTGVFDLFVSDLPAFDFVDWWFDAIEVTPSNTSANSGKATIVDNTSVANGQKVTVTFRNNSASAATDFATNDLIYGYLAFITIKQ